MNEPNNKGAETERKSTNSTNSMPRTTKIPKKREKNQGTSSTLPVAILTRLTHTANCRDIYIYIYIYRMRESGRQEASITQNF
jgi:hypothetical protein